MWSLFLESLHNITFTGADGKQDRLSSHLVAVVMAPPNANADACQRASGHRGVRCAPMHSSWFQQEIYFKSPAWAALSYAKISSLLAALSLGVDVLFLDSDQVFFKNPLPYLLARDADVLVTGDCWARDDTVPLGQLPPYPNNIGFVYARSKPMSVRMAANWLATLVLQARSSGGGGGRKKGGGEDSQEDRAGGDRETDGGEAGEEDAEGEGEGGRRSLKGRSKKKKKKKYDQGTFKLFFEELHESLGEETVKYLSISMLSGDVFPHACSGPCGCNTTGLEPGAKAVQRSERRADGTCDPQLMRTWYHFHKPCDTDPASKVAFLRELLHMYQRLVGPVNALSEPVRVIGGT
ncbi:hypothetical protein HYH03_010364 [Edaphochlamys debaryana]|uniref:Nucleotide-diphospho-sugar transferase domain-containing protein n=1 Tax=Edaphochlamys debaryana TaxID=47281 RepID=A0A836BWD6_9CHLO|nr:hypothetical protein HYH03_010364 [Edaphochlamys debaryana]|eukprot:KAG2491365.1 hypothetical protein HYH03_010364 [Edaphochlamys debaryana]